MIIRGKEDISISRLRRSALLDPLLMRQLRRTLMEGSLISVGSMNDTQLLDALEQGIEAGRIDAELFTELLRSVPEPSGGGSVPVAARDSAEEQEDEGPQDEVPVAQISEAWIGFRVVHDMTDIPIPGVSLSVKLTDGSQKEYRTADNGEVFINAIDPGTCDVSCDIREALLRDTYAFTAMGDSPASQTAQSGAPQSAGNDQGKEKSRTRSRVAMVQEHKVKSGETLAQIATDNGLTWQELAKFNWDTATPDEINEHLRHDVGKTKKTRDGYNYVFADSDDPGFLYIPKPWQQAGLVTEQQHTIRVKQAEGFRIILENEAGLRIPEAAYEVTLADGSTRQGRLGRSGVALIKDFPPGQIEVEFLDLDDVTAKSLAARARKAFEERDTWDVFRLLKDAKVIVHKAIEAYDQYFNDYSGNGLLQDIDYELTDPTAHSAVKALLREADVLPGSDNDTHSREGQ